MSSTTYKIGEFTEMANAEPIQYNGREGDHLIMNGVITFYDEDGKGRGSCFAVVYDLDRDLMARVRGWNKDTLWAEDIDLDEVQSWTLLGTYTSFRHE